MAKYEVALRERAAHPPVVEVDGPAEPTREALLWCGPMHDTGAPSSTGRAVASTLILGRPMSCMPGNREVINTYTVGFLTIPRASIKWV